MKESKKASEWGKLVKGKNKLTIPKKGYPAARSHRFQSRLSERDEASKSTRQAFRVPG